MRGGAGFRVLVGVVQIIRLAVHHDTRQRILKVLRQRKFFDDVRDAGNLGEARGHDKFRLEAGGGEHGVEQNGAVSQMTIAVGQRGVGGG